MQVISWLGQYWHELLEEWWWPDSHIWCYSTLSSSVPACASPARWINRGGTSTSCFWLWVNIGSWRSEGTAFISSAKHLRTKAVMSWSWFSLHLKMSYTHNTHTTHKHTDYSISDPLWLDWLYLHQPITVYNIFLSKPNMILCDQVIRGNGEGGIKGIGCVYIHLHQTFILQFFSIA